MQQQSRQDSYARKVDHLRDTLKEWDSLACELHRLGKSQLDAILEPSRQSLGEILNQKSRAYRTAAELSGQVRALNDEIPDQVVHTTSFEQQWREIESLRSSILKTITELAVVESRSEQLIRERMQQIQADLESMHNTRGITGVYGKKRANTPRFLDQKR